MYIYHNGFTILWLTSVKTKFKFGTAVWSRKDVYYIFTFLSKITKVFSILRENISVNI